MIFIDGLIQIAEAQGVINLTTAVGPGVEGLTATCTLFSQDKQETTTATMDEAVKTVRRMSPIWTQYPERMLMKFVTEKAIRSTFPEAVKAVEGK